MIVRRAALRLTLVYTVIQLASYAVVATAIYAFVTGTFDYDTVRSDGIGAVNAAEAGFAHLRGGLVLSFLVQLALIPVLSYAMARRALRPVRANLEAQQRFVDNASHEFRTPLSILQADIELTLSRPRSSRDYVRTLQEALVEVSSLTALTADLLILARRTSEQDSGPAESVSLLTVARTARARALRASTDPAPIDIHAPHDVYVPGSQELLTRAVGNLLDNALHHTPSSGKVTISLEQNTATATLHVIDNGTGMSATAQRRAFDRFWRDAESTTHPGHGLGLTLVAQIAAAHHGQAAISPTPGGGATVTLTLPR